MTIFNPYLELVAEMTPTEFEKLCYDILSGFAEEENLLNFSIIHNDHIPCHDGEYQIDIHATCTVLKSKIDILIECKKYKKQIERKVIAELNQKIESVGAHKGIVISTSGFQEGAARFAEEHGIALVQIANSSINFIKASAYKIINPFEILLQEYYPPFIALVCDDTGYPYNEIYPTNQMKKDIVDKIRREHKCPTIQQ